jgi:RNA polymerase sigma-70 factor (ECF subfamily)
MARFREEDFVELSALAEQAQAGDAEAYDDLLRRLYRLVGAIVRARLGAVVAVDDVVQECLLAVHKSLSSYRPSRSFRPWIMAIIRYKLTDHFRDLSKRNEQTLDERNLPVTDQDPAANAMGDGTREATEDVGELVAALPEPLRRAVVLTKLRGLSCTEVARQEGVSDAAMRKRVSRAYKKLANAYKNLDK